MTIHAHRVQPHPTVTGLPDEEPGSQDPAEVVRGLYHDHEAALLAYAGRFTRDRMVAEDAVQEVFVRAWQHLPALLHDDRPLRPWLRTVLRHVLTDNARAARTRPVTLIDEPVPDIDVDGGYDALLDRELLREAIHHLSSAHRQVLVETYYRGSPADCVAQMIGIPVGTVRSRLHYALIALREQLGVQGPVQA